MSKIYTIFLHNNPITPFNIVVEILKEIFGKKEDQAYRVMMAVHQSGPGGKGPVVKLPKKIAEEKISAVNDWKMNRNCPELEFSMEEDKGDS